MQTVEDLQMETTRGAFERMAAAEEKRTAASEQQE